MLVLGFIFVCLWFCCTVSKILCSSYGFFVICWHVFEFWLVLRFQLFYLLVCYAYCKTSYVVLSVSLSWASFIFGNRFANGSHFCIAPFHWVNFSLLRSKISLF